MRQAVPVEREVQVVAGAGAALNLPAVHENNNTSEFHHHHACDEAPMVNGRPNGAEQKAKWLRLSQWTHRKALQRQWDRRGQDQCSQK